MKNLRLFFAAAVMVFLLAGCFFSSQEKAGKERESDKSKLIRELSEKVSAEGVLSEPLINEFGIRRKVVTRSRGIRCSSNPGGPKDREELRYFHPYFVFEEEKRGDLTYLLVGSTPRRANILGWVISPNDVQEWNTRMGNRLKRNAGPDDVPLPPLFVYNSAENVRNVIKGENIQPIAQTSYKYEHQTLMPWPVIHKEYFKHGGRTYEIHQIAFLGAYQEGSDISKDPSATAPIESPSKEEHQDFVRSVEAGTSKMDVIFVIDATGSMGPYIKEVKEAVKKIGTNLGNLAFKPDIAFGVVEYRDYDDGYPDIEEPFKFHRLTESQKDFEKIIDDISAIAGGDDQEAVFDGVLAGLILPAWRGDLSERILILVGDFSGHEPGAKQNPKNISLNDLIVRATSGNNKIRIFSLRVKNRGNEEERKRHEFQFTELAVKTGGKSFPLENATELVPAVEEVITLRVDDRVDYLEVIREISEGRLDPETKAPKRGVSFDIDDRKIVEVLEFLEGAGVDYRKLAPGQTLFSTGWVLTESMDVGMELLEKEVYLARSELNTLMSNLYSLVNFLDKPEMMQSLVLGSAFTRIEGTSEVFQNYFSADTMEKMDVWLMLQIVPVGKHSILNFSKDEIKSMPEAQRMTIAEKIQGVYIPALTVDGNDNNRFSEPGPISFGWVRERFLP